MTQTTRKRNKPRGLRQTALAVVLACATATRVLSAEPPACADYATATGAPEAAALVERLHRVLAPFPPLTQAMAAQNPEVCLEPGTTDARGYFDVEHNMIGIRASLTEGQRLATLVHESRHVEQLSRGFCPTTRYTMKENARATFALEADAQAMAVIVGYAARDAEPGLWEALLAWQRYGDIAEKFGAVMDETGDLNQAAAAAFDQWFASDWRIEVYYLTSCSDYLDRLDAENLLPGAELLPPTYLQSICRLPDGSSYDCDPPE